MPGSDYLSFAITVRGRICLFKAQAIQKRASSSNDIKRPAGEAFAPPWNEETRDGRATRASAVREKKHTSIPG